MVLYCIPEYPATVTLADAFNKNRQMQLGYQSFLILMSVLCGCRNSAVRSVVAFLEKCPDVRLCAAHTPWLIFQ